MQNKIDNQLTEIEKLKQDISKTSVNVLKNEESSQVQKDVLHKIRSEIEVLQAKMDNNKLLQFHIYNYLKTRDIYNQYTNQAVNSKKFYTNHEHEIDLHKKAKEYFNTLNVKKLPSLQYLRAEFSDLVQQKDFLSADLKRAKEIEKKHEEPRRFISSNYDMER